jgi:hypothetical protein
MPYSNLSINLATSASNTANIVIAYETDGANSNVGNAVVLSIAVDYSNIFERLAITANNIFGQLTALNQNVINTNSILQNTYVVLNDTKNILQNTQVVFQNTQSVLQNTHNVLLNTYNVFVDIESDTTGINIALTHVDAYMNNINYRGSNNDIGFVVKQSQQDAGPLSAEQERAIVVSTLKTSGGLDNMIAEINNPTPLPGDV